MVVARAALAGVHPVLEIGVAPGDIDRVVERVAPERCSPQVGVQQHAGGVDDAAKLCAPSSRNAYRGVGDHTVECHRLAALHPVARSVDGLASSVHEEWLREPAEASDDTFHGWERSARVRRHGEGSVERRAECLGGPPTI